MHCYMAKNGWDGTILYTLLVAPDIKDEKVKFEREIYFFLIPYYIEYVSYALYYLVNAILYIDLYLIVTNPFYPQKRRNVMYNVVMVSFSILWIVYFMI